MYQILEGDCLDKLDELEEKLIDCIITDPPYGLTSITKRFGKEGSAPAQYGKDGAYARLSKGFMGKEWDGSGIEYNVEMWAKCLRVLKPGGYLLSFGGTRTYHNEIYNTGLDKGISNEVLEELTRVMKKINIYIFCNKTQLRQYINFFESRGGDCRASVLGEIKPRADLP